jgi:hypothetical protein
MQINMNRINENKCIVSIDNLDLYFSYDTIIAFRNKGKLCCSENQWSNTTGKFLNEIQPDKSKRMPAAEFNDLLESLHIDCTSQR